MARPPIKGKRLFKLASMTASVAGGFARSKVKSLLSDAEGQAEEARRFRVESGERIASTLGELKGAAMKVGQFASAAKELFPPEVADALKTLQREAPPMAYEVIAEQIEVELGAPPEVLFQRFERTPFAAASVGQVHRATTDDGREVVVKVQYPGVDGAVDSDLDQVRLALRLGGLVKVPRDMLDAFFAELRERLHEELDYCNEADNVRMFGAFHRDHPGLIVPEVVGERSAKRVLTLTYEPGEHFDALRAEDTPQALRDQVGTRLAEMITSQVFELGAIHGDPNPANFAFRRDGRVVLYDFGCVKVLRPDIVEAIRDLLVAARVRDCPGLDAAMIALGPLRPEAAPVPEDFYGRWMDALAPPLWQEGAYDFGASRIGEEVIRLVPGAIKHASWWQPAPELAILDRMVAGHYDNGRAMGARVPTRALMERYLPPRSP